MDTSHTSTASQSKPPQAKSSQPKSAPPQPATTVAPRIQTFKAKLSEKVVYNEIFELFHFEIIAPPRLLFKAGQYILLSIPGSTVRKSYSIASVPATDHALELLIDMRPQGIGTKYLGSLTPGDEIEFMGPVGGFVIPGKDSIVGKQEQELFLVATGSGVAPYRSMIEDLLIEQAQKRRITLLWGLRHAEHQFWFNDFSVLATQHRNFEFRPILSQPPDDWPLDRGRVTDVLRARDFDNISQIGFYLCGGAEMVKDCRVVLREIGVPENHVHSESFT